MGENFINITKYMDLSTVDNDKLLLVCMSIVIEIDNSLVGLKCVGIQYSFI